MKNGSIVISWDGDDYDVVIPADEAISRVTNAAIIHSLCAGVRKVTLKGALSCVYVLSPYDLHPHVIQYGRTTYVMDSRIDAYKLATVYQTDEPEVDDP